MGHKQSGGLGIHQLCPPRGLERQRERKEEHGGEECEGLNNPGVLHCLWTCDLRG